VQPIGGRLPIQRIAHLDNDEHGQGTRLGLGGVEYVAVDARKHPRLRRTLHVMRLTTPMADYPIVNLRSFCRQQTFQNVPIPKAPEIHNMSTFVLIL